MLLALLLLAHARAEWVEIAQVPRKPITIRTHQQTTESELTLQTRRESTLQISTEPTRVLGKNNNRIYINHSLEHTWSKGVVHRVPNVGNVKRIRLTTEEPARSKYEETDLSVLSQGYTKRNSFKTFEERIPEFVTKEESFEDDDEVEEIHFERKPPEKVWTEGNEIKVKGEGNKPSIPERRIDIKETEHVTSKTADRIRNNGPNTETTESDEKVNTMENVLKFVKVVTDTISRNTRRSFSSKLRYLEDLKDTMIVNIEDGIESLFPDDPRGAGAARRRRRARASGARGHVEFPSSEGALMTLSFLTFAVYLIKLVLQVIQSYKNKTMMMTPAVFAAVGRAAKRKEN